MTSTRKPFDWDFYSNLVAAARTLSPYYDQWSNGDDGRLQFAVDSIERYLQDRSFTQIEILLPYRPNFLTHSYAEP